MPYLEQDPEDCPTPEAVKAVVKKYQDPIRAAHMRGRNIGRSESLARGVFGYMSRIVAASIVYGSDAGRVWGYCGPMRAKFTSVLL